MERLSILYIAFISTTALCSNTDPKNYSHSLYCFEGSTHSNLQAKIRVHYTIDFFKKFEYNYDRMMLQLNEIFNNANDFFLRQIGISFIYETPTQFIDDDMNNMVSFYSVDNFLEIREKARHGEHDYDEIIVTVLFNACHEMSNYEGQAYKRRICFNESVAIVCHSIGMMNYVFIHEIGHSLGAEHINNTVSVMNSPANINSNFIYDNKYLENENFRRMICNNIRKKQPYYPKCLRLVHFRMSESLFFDGISNR